MRRLLAVSVLVLLAALPAPAGAARLQRLDSLAARTNLAFGGFPSWRSGLRPLPPCSDPALLAPQFVAAARSFGLRPSIVAAISEVESGHGCNMGPSSAGAIGWTQFLPSTWQAWGMDADGDGRASPYSSADAIFSSARYLRASGAPRSYRKALFAYNHANWYVNQVLALSRKFK